MTLTHRILSPRPIASLDEYLDLEGRTGLSIAVEMSAEQIIETVEGSGLRGRGGAGFPTGVKWRTVADMASTRPVTVVVNGAEGEPGSFKDRTIIRNNPDQVIEGALIAARAVDASTVAIAVKEQFVTEVERLRSAIDEFTQAGVSDVQIELVEGPSSYLFGEESALLEVVDGRPPLPRVTPPYRRGVGDTAGDANTANTAELAGDSGVEGSPALVNNVETLANVAYIFRHGVDHFRSVGTPETPGTTVCTLTGAIDRHGVAEFVMGTPLWEVIDTLGGGALPGRTLIAAISGTANVAVTAEHFDTPLCFEQFRRIGSGLGAAGFIVFDDHTDFAAAAHGVARFLAVESCGQCEPCKFDGAAISDRLDEIRRSDIGDADAITAEVEQLFASVATGARCGLAGQHQTAVASLHELARSANRSHADRTLAPADQVLVAPLVDIVDGRAVMDRSHLDKALDWTIGGPDSGKAPVDRL